jgi:BlaI family transcriptional regulator, penicillinase repressor
MSDPNPTDGELAILRVLWSRNAPMTVREVHEVMQRTKDTAYTTVLKILTIMNDKGLVQRDESERSHRFVARHAEPVVEASMLKAFVQRAFGGSASKLVQRALDQDTASSEDLDAIARMITAAKARKKRK